MLDRIVDAANKLPGFVQSHAQAISFIAGSLFCLTGYVGWHWLERRLFYRCKLADPFPTYFKAWRTMVIEGNLRWVFLLAVMFGLLMIFAGVIDWIDG